MGARTRNTAAVAFAGTGTVRWTSLWDAETGGNFQGKDELATAQALPATFPVNNLTLQVGDSTTLTDANDIHSVTARRNSATHLQVHDDDPGDDGTENIIAGVDRKAITWGAVESF